VLFKVSAPPPAVPGGGRGRNYPVDSWNPVDSCAPELVAKSTPPPPPRDVAGATSLPAPTQTLVNAQVCGFCEIDSVRSTRKLIFKLRVERTPSIEQIGQNRALTNVCPERSRDLVERTLHNAESADFATGSPGTAIHRVPAIHRVARSESGEIPRSPPLEKRHEPGPASRTQAGNAATQDGAARACPAHAETHTAISQHHS
jgi:hypothetical protein